MSDSPAVLALIAKRDAMRYDDSDWGRDHRKWLGGRIRAQRLAEARERGTHTDDEWEAVLDRYDRRCVCCGCRPEGRPCKDHIVAITRGGSDSIENLQPLCRECNSTDKFAHADWRPYRDQHGFTEEA